MRLLLAVFLLVGVPLEREGQDSPTPAFAQDREGGWRAGVAKSCLDCHGPDKPKGNLNLESILKDEPARHAGAWEKVVRRLRTRQMPPPGKNRPTEEAYAAMVSSLETALDAVPPRPGTPDTIRRLTRLEYQNAIRDLLGLEVDASALLPADESSHGFDSATAGTLSPTLLERTLSAAQKIARLAVGGVGRSPGGDTFRVPPDVTQEERAEGLPPGTRGGLRIPYTFPQEGGYDVRVRLMRDRDEFVEGLTEPHELVLLLDRKVVRQFTVKPGDPARVDAHLVARLPVPAGPHELAVTFLKKPSPVAETLRQPYDARFNVHRHPRLSPAVYEVSITGPYDARGAARRLFAPEATDAKAVLAPLLRRAWRRPVTDADLERILRVFRQEPDFDRGLEAALAAILVSHEFLFRVERTTGSLGDVALASRLSFFLWSSLPDDALLDLAERGELARPETLAAQARRMLADPRSRTLVTSFAAQWLHLPNLRDFVPDRRLFPDFDDNLRQAMRRETELLFEEILREDRSVMGLVRSDHAWLNERLAKHYGIPHVYGTHFRKVALDPASRRGGLLRHGSVLAVTSYATRTSPVLRGKWVLENLLGTPPPPPLPDVPALDDNAVSANLPGRERLRQHREKPACAVCHDRIDPVGFALENFDAVGRWRDLDADRPVDASGVLPDGSAAEGVDGLEAALLRRPDVFATALAEKLLTYALGRGVNHEDGPAVRAIVRAAAADDYRLSALIVGIVKSVPFRMRTSP